MRLKAGLLRCFACRGAPPKEQQQLEPVAVAYVERSLRQESQASTYDVDRGDSFATALSTDLAAASIGSLTGNPLFECECDHDARSEYGTPLHHTPFDAGKGSGQPLSSASHGNGHHHHHHHNEAGCQTHNHTGSHTGYHTGGHTGGAHEHASSTLTPSSAPTSLQHSPHGSCSKYKLTRPSQPSQPSQPAVTAAATAAHDQKGVAGVATVAAPSTPACTPLPAAARQLQQQYQGQYRQYCAQQQYQRCSVQSQQQQGEPQPAVMGTMASVASVIHGQGAPFVRGELTPFQVRGEGYSCMPKPMKQPAGPAVFSLHAMDMYNIQGEELGRRLHIARFMPHVRQGAYAFAILINLIIPGPPDIAIISTFITHTLPLALQPGTEKEWTGFDRLLHKYLTTPEEAVPGLEGDPHIRASDGRKEALKLVCKLEGTSAAGFMLGGLLTLSRTVWEKAAPKVGKALDTRYARTARYLEIDAEVKEGIAAWATGKVRGVTRCLKIDVGFILEGVAPCELPERLLGAFRTTGLDVADARPLPTEEVPLASPPATEPLKP